MFVRDDGYARVGGGLAGAGRQTAEYEGPSERTINVRDQPLDTRSVSSILKRSESASDSLSEQLAALSATAERAENLALRLTGPFLPPPSPEVGGASTGGGRDPDCAMEAIYGAVLRLDRRISTIETQRSRLAQALDAIERALG